MAYSHDRNKIYTYYQKVGPIPFKEYMREHQDDKEFIEIATEILESERIKLS